MQLLVRPSSGFYFYFLFSYTRWYEITREISLLYPRRRRFFYFYFLLYYYLYIYTCTRRRTTAFICSARCTGTPLKPRTEIDAYRFNVDSRSRARSFLIIFIFSCRPFFSAVAPVATAAVCTRGVRVAAMMSARQP